MGMDILKGSWLPYTLVAGAGLVVLLAGSALILRWRAVGEAVDLEKGVGASGSRTSAKIGTRQPGPERGSSSLSSISSVSTVGGSARPM